MRTILTILLIALSVSVVGQSTDNFDSYANGSFLSAAANWVSELNDMIIQASESDGGFSPYDSAEISVYCIGTFNDNQYSQFVFEYVQTGMYIGVSVRNSGAGAQSYYGWYTGKTKSYLFKVINGTYIQFDEGTVWTNLDTVKLEIIGNELRCYRNGELDISIMGTGKYTDNSLTSGNPGVCGFGNSASTTGDLWSGGNVVATTYSPVAGRHVWFTKDGVRLIPKHDGLSVYPKQKHGLTELDSIIYLFADNFETFPTGPLSYDTLMAHFQVWRANFYEDNQSIIDLNDGDHEKVFHSKILEGEYGAGKGFEINIPLDSLYDEIWVDLDVRAMPGFNGDETPGHWSGKFPIGGAYGGLNYSYYGDSTRISSEEWGAWWVHTVWSNNESMCHYAYTLSGARNAEGYIGQIPTSWKHYSTKIKVSDPGSSNGTKEVFIDGNYSSHLVGLKMRSIEQGEDYGLIEGAKLSFFFGGSGASYASQQDQWIEFDNIVVSYANSGTRKNTDLYTTGNKIWYPNSTLNNVQPDSILFCEDFTANSGTIQSHYTINRPPDSKRTYRKTITVTEGSHINIDFDYYRDSYNSWIKIYTGVGGSKSATPLYAFNRNNLASPYSTYHISDNEVTIEYCIGTSYSPLKGWKLTYEEVLP